MYFVEDLLGAGAPRLVSGSAQGLLPRRRRSARSSRIPRNIYPLITGRVIDFIRTRVTAIGGITQAKKIATLCEVFGVKTAFQEGGENDPVNQTGGLPRGSLEHRLRHPGGESFSAAGARDDAGHRPRSARAICTAAASPGLGIDINEEMAAKYPDCGQTARTAAYKTDRTLDGTVIKP